MVSRGCRSRFGIDRLHVTQDWSVGSGHQIVFGTTSGGRLIAEDNSCLFMIECGWHIQFNEQGEHQEHLSNVILCESWAKLCGADFTPFGNPSHSPFMN